MTENQFFVSAVDLSRHPMRRERQALKSKYYYVLKHYIEECISSPYVDKWLDLYAGFLEPDGGEDLDYRKCEKTMVGCRPWRNKYKLWLVCDLALITGDLAVCRMAAELMKKITTQRQGKLLDDLINRLSSGACIEKARALETAEDLIRQYWDNKAFRKAPERRIVITANMSAGKSTLINALVGKNIARTSQEACTGNICYFYNLPFDDGMVHFKGSTISLSASEKEYKTFAWDTETAFATAFLSAYSIADRMCFIDTPGVNSAISREHGRISKRCIREGDYEQILYILNANRLGTDEEISYLKWIAKNVPTEKVIFALNKLDDFKSVEDNIALSLEGIRSDLEQIGYVNPAIFPVSAYFAYLLKVEKQGMPLSEDEIDELALFKKKFSRSEYNLSAFYGRDECGSDFDGYMRRSGFYYLEKKLYGGMA